MRCFGIFCAVVWSLFAVAGVIGLKAARAEQATWYGDPDGVNPQACADYPQATCTCGSSHFQIGTHLQVSFRDRSVVCRVNDRGPFKWTVADIVLSFGAASALGMPDADLATVSIRRMGRME